MVELNVPGIKLEFLKRSHDLALRLLVQDLFLVDRIQTFGPEFELVVCSSGKSLLGLSPVPPTQQLFKTTPTSPLVTPTPSSEDKNFNIVPNLSSVNLFEDGGGGGGVSGDSLLALSYQLIKPQSPQHPAMLEAEGMMDEGGGGGGGGGGKNGREEGSVSLEGEAIIHRINVQTTAVDAIGKE